MDGFDQEDSFKVVIQKCHLAGRTIFDDRMLLGLKNLRAADETCKERFIIQRYVDRQNTKLIHMFNIINRKWSGKLFSSLKQVATDYGGGYHTIVPKQHQEIFVRDILYGQRNQVFPHKSKQLLKPFKPLCVLTNSNDFWHGSRRRYLMQDMMMEHFTEDHAFCKILSETLSVLVVANISTTFSKIKR